MNNKLFVIGMFLVVGIGMTLAFAIGVHYPLISPIPIEPEVRVECTVDSIGSPVVCDTLYVYSR